MQDFTKNTLLWQGGLALTLLGLSVARGQTNARENEGRFLMVRMARAVHVATGASDKTDRESEESDEKGEVDNED